MKSFHPASWSQQARKLADNQFDWFRRANECGDPDSWLIQKDPNTGLSLADEESYVIFFSTSYRHPRIRHRAAKRFGRLVRKYKRG